MWMAERQAVASTACGSSSRALARLSSAPLKSWLYCWTMPLTTQYWASFADDAASGAIAAEA